MIPWLNLSHNSALRKPATIEKNGCILFSMTIDSIDEQILHPLHPLLRNQKPIREEARPRPEPVSDEKPWRLRD